MALRTRSLISRATRRLVHAIALSTAFQALLAGAAAACSNGNGFPN